MTPAMKVLGLDSGRAQVDDFVLAGNALVANFNVVALIYVQVVNGLITQREASQPPADVFTPRFSSAQIAGGRVQRSRSSWSKVASKPLAVLSEPLVSLISANWPMPVLSDPLRVVLPAYGPAKKIIIIVRTQK